MTRPDLTMRVAPNFEPSTLSFTTPGSIESHCEGGCYMIAPDTVTTLDASRSALALTSRSTQVRGEATANDRYWGMSNFVWNNDGDKATLVKRSGRIADSCSYAGGESPNPPKYC